MLTHSSGWLSRLARYSCFSVPRYGHGARLICGPKLFTTPLNIRTRSWRRAGENREQWSEATHHRSLITCHWAASAFWLVGNPQPNLIPRTAFEPKFLTPLVTQ